MKKIAAFALCAVAATAARAEIRIGMIGCDTSHSLEFTSDFNVKKVCAPIGDFRVTCAYQWGSRDIVSMTNRYPRYLPKLGEMGVKMVPTIAELLAQVDAVLLETNDGSEHEAQALEVFRSGKPVFIDKPLSNTFAGALRIVEAAKACGAKFFTTSSNRFQPNPARARAGEFGPIASVVLHAPYRPMEKHGRYTWYAIHGFEILETAMGPGCSSVTITAGSEDDIASCVWKDGRVGVVHLQKTWWEMGGYMLLKEPKGNLRSVDIGRDEGYEELVKQIALFFKTGVVPVDPAESLEIAAMMEAASVSRERGGVPVTISEVMAAAKRHAE